MAASPITTAQATSHPMSAEVFSPATIGAVTFLFGFPAGLLLATITWRRLGHDHEARDYLVKGGFGTVAFIAALLLLPDGIGTLLALAVNVAMLFHLRQKTEEAITFFTIEGRTVWTTHWIFGVALGVAVLGCVAFLAVAGAMLLALFV